MRMYNPPHPGEILRELWLEPMNISVTKMASHLHVSRKALSELVNARTSLSAEMAMRLELALGKSADSWLAHQADFDLWHLQSRSQSLGVKAIAMPSA